MNVEWEGTSLVRLAQSRTRYAVYLTPPPGSPLAVAAQRWLGRSAFAASPPGAAGPQPMAPEAARVDIPARYGFHATMRAPFRLAEGTDEAALRSHFAERYAGRGTTVRLTVASLAHFVALTAPGDAHLGELAEAAVRQFEPFRARLTDEERARRRPDRLDDRGRALLDAYGYPHVMERFEFHMTLSGPVEGDIGPVVAAARTHFAALIDQPVRLVHALFAEAGAGGPFHVIAIEGQPDPDH